MQNTEQYISKEKEYFGKILGIFFSSIFGVKSMHLLYPNFVFLGQSFIMKIQTPQSVVDDY